VATPRAQPPVARPSVAAAITIGVALVLAGCGGGGAKRFSRPAFEACLHDHSAQTQSYGQALGGADIHVKKLLQPIAPNLIAVKFPSGEFAGIAFSKDAAGARRIRDALTRIAKAGGTLDQGKFEQDGTLLLILPPHVTAGTDSIIKDCEKSSALT
jgi:hypothetical protein